MDDRELNSWVRMDSEVGPMRRDEARGEMCGGGCTKDRRAMAKNRTSESGGVRERERETE